jgi:hypothetical protein
MAGNMNGVDVLFQPPARHQRSISRSPVVYLDREGEPEV